MYGINYDAIYALCGVSFVLIVFVFACLSVFRYTGNCVLHFGMMVNEMKRRETRKKIEELRMEREGENEELIEMEEEEGG